MMAEKQKHVQKPREPTRFWSRKPRCEESRLVCFRNTVFSELRLWSLHVSIAFALIGKSYITMLTTKIIIKPIANYPLSGTHNIYYYSTATLRLCRRWRRKQDRGDGRTIMPENRAMLGKGGHIDKTAITARLYAI